MVLWNGPLGKIGGSQPAEDLGSAKGTYQIAQAIIQSKAESIIGGGDTIAALDKWGLLDKFSFVSTGGGAMLELLVKGTLPTIEALDD
jgi:phosphoglycerate kinase